MPAPPCKAHKPDTGKGSPVISAHSREQRAFDLAEAAAEILEQASQISSSSWKARGDAVAFDAMYLPSLSIRNYSLRLRKYCNCSDECHVLALVYIDRLLERNADFMVTPLNAHRLLLAATVIAAKFQDDDIYSNRFYSKVGGVSHEELGTLEAKFLIMIGWRAHVAEAEYNHCLKCLHDNWADAHKADTSAADEVIPAQEPEVQRKITSSSPPTHAQNSSATQGESVAQEVLERVLPSAAKKRQMQRSGPAACVSRQKQRHAKCGRREARGRTNTCYARPRTRFNERRFHPCPAARRGTVP
jgi:hypothetical protein